MKATRFARRPAVMATALIAAAGLSAGSVALTESAAVAAPAAARATTSHTLHLVAKQLRDVMVNRTDVATDKDVQNGKTTGYDVTSCAINVDTHMANCTVALARHNGLLIGHAKIDVQTGHGSGTITGGTRAMRGATGTISVAPGSSSGSTKITVHYQV